MTNETNANYESLLTDLRRILSELLDVQEQKQSALLERNAATLSHLGDHEASLITSLEDCSRRRAALIDENAPDSAGDVLSRILFSIHGPDRTRLARELREVRRLAHLLRRRAASVWIASRRASETVDHLLELVGKVGRSPLERRPTRGIVLDCTA